MIILFPLLIDESISANNAVPGVCKALEKFMLIYELDSIMKISGLKILSIGGKLATAAISTGKGLLKTNEQEGISPRDVMGGRIPLTKAQQQRVDYILTQIQTSQSPPATSKNEIVKTALDSMDKIRSVGTVKVDMPRQDFISLEPTYTIANTASGSRLLGIKVIPIPVKSKYSLADLLMVDASMKLIDRLGLKIYRKVIRAFGSVMRRLPILKDRTITGDPEKDILWAWSYHKNFVFCLLNYADITDSEFFKNAGGVHKLHKLYWNSFVALDDVNKRAIFCMKHFHGLCSSVSYPFLYSSLSSDQSKVYEKLEDIKKSASPFLKTSLSLKKLSESVSVIEKYLKRIK